MIHAYSSSIKLKKELTKEQAMKISKISDWEWDACAEETSVKS